MSKPEKEKKSIIGFVLSLILFAFVLYIFISAIVAKRENKPFTFFGYSTAIVQTGSMEPDIKVGDLIVIKSAKITDAKVGDFAVFISHAEAIKGERVVHRVVETGEDGEGYYIVTLGNKNDKNPAPVPDTVRESDFVGIAILNNAFLGKTISFFTHTENIIFTAVIIVIIVFSVKQIVKIVKTSKESTESAQSAGGENQPQNDEDKS